MRRSAQHTAMGLGAASMAMDFERRVETTTGDGTVLSVGVVEPPSEPIGVILALHAMMVNARSLDRPMGQGFLSHLARRGFLGLAADFRGHGRSGTPVARGGSWTYDDIVSKDVPALIDLAHDLASGKKLAIVGHSLGGHATAAWLGQHPDSRVSALVFVASNLWMRRLETHRVRRLRKDLEMALLAASVRLFGRFPARTYSMGSDDEPTPYMRQLVDVYRKSAWRSRDGKVDYLQGLNRIGVRTLLVTGQGDTLWCPADAARTFHSNLPEEVKTHWNAGLGSFGLNYDPGHMALITDPRSAPLWDAIARWLKSPA